jgi:hypothetical protein
VGVGHVFFFFFSSFFFWSMSASFSWAASSRGTNDSPHGTVDGNIAAVKEKVGGKSA